MFCGQPISQTHTQLLDALDAADTSGQVGTQKTTVGGLIGKASHYAQTEVDRPRSELSRFEVTPISEHYCPIERETWFRTVPVNELVDGVTYPRWESRLVKLFKTAALACSRSGRRKTVFALLRLIRERGFSFMTCGLHATKP